MAVEVFFVFLKKIRDKIAYKTEYVGKVIKAGITYKKYKKIPRFIPKHRKPILFVAALVSLLMIMYLFVLLFR